MAVIRGLLAASCAAALWIAQLHLWFERAPEDVARPLAARQLALWQPAGAGELEASLAAMRRANPEWDLMTRLFTVLAFANLALDRPGSPEAQAYAAAIDRIVERTIADAGSGAGYFLLPYGRNQELEHDGWRSLFVDHAGRGLATLRTRLALAYGRGARFTIGALGDGRTRAVLELRAPPA